MNTVAHTELHNIWGGKVIVDEIKQFTDDRGMVSELWRIDDAKTMEFYEKPAMSYWSLTKPFVQRGFHEHASQVDFFITWFSRMVYQLYNPETKEMFHFITDPTKVYRVKVGIGIIHSYRNLDIKISTTGNFPSSLFMGYDKKSPIDEKRYEEQFKDLPTYIIFGAGGRLGKALINYLYKNIGFQKYNVVPIFEKVNSKEDIDNLFYALFKNNLFDISKTKFINCAALTNTKNYFYPQDKLSWSNIAVPTNFASSCLKFGVKFYQIGTDYVYREDDDSQYTESKKLMEEEIKNVKGTNIIRVANLFSLDKDDTSNIVSKIKERISSGQEITSDPSLFIFPTEVSKLAHEIVSYIDNPLSSNTINICGKPYTLDDMSCLFFGHPSVPTRVPFKQNSELFLKDAVIIDCDKEIKEKIV